MKQFFLVVFIIQAVISVAQSKEGVVNKLLLSNISVISMKNNKILENQDVKIQNGKIISIKKSKKLKEKDFLFFDGSGKYIMPSLSDAHMHFPASELEMQQVLKLNLINGVTKLRSMRGEWQHTEWRKKFNTPDGFYPKLYLSPPPITRNDDLTKEQIELFVKKAKENKFDFIKILSLKSAATFTNLDVACKKYKMVIGGHFPVVTAGDKVSDKTIFNSNYRAFEHLGGLAGESVEMITDRIELLKRNNITICPTLSWYDIGSGRNSISELKTLRGMEFVSKTKMNDWIASTIEYRDKIGEEVYKSEVIREMKRAEDKYKIIKQLDQAGVNMILSPDASSKYMIAGFNVLGEMELVKNANISNYSILKMATLNFAKFFNEDFGTVEVGKAADFIILDKNPLEDLSALKEIKGLFYNNHFLDDNTLHKMREVLLRDAQN